MKEVLKGKRFATVEEAKQKTAEALKGIEMDGIDFHCSIQFRNCFEQWKTSRLGVLHQTDSALKVTEV